MSKLGASDVPHLRLSLSSGRGPVYWEPFCCRVSGTKISTFLGCRSTSVSQIQLYSSGLNPEIVVEYFHVGGMLNEGDAMWPGANSRPKIGVSRI